MKILQIIPNLNKGGAERLVLDICNELLNNPENKVKLITFSNSNEYEYLSKNIDGITIPSSFIPSISGKAKVNVKDLQEIVDRFKPDIIHSHLWETELILSQIIYSKAKWFTHFHSNMPQIDGSLNLFRKKRITDYYEKKLVLRSYRQKKTKFLAISKHTDAYAKQVLPNVFSKRIEFLSNAIDYYKFFNSKKKDNGLDKTVNLVSVGSLVEKKNHIFLVKIVKYLNEKGIKSKLVILGEGPKRAEIQTLVSKLNLKNNIFLKGNVDSVEDYLSKADLYVHSALYEPFGLVLLEAMASGLPVICLDGKGNRDLIFNNENGFILNSDNPSLFGDKIIQIVKDKEMYNRIRNNAFSFAKEYDIKQYVNQLLQIYNKPTIK